MYTSNEQALHGSERVVLKGSNQDLQTYILDVVVYR